MIVAGAVLAILGFVFGVHLLWVLGIVLLVMDPVLLGLLELLVVLLVLGVWIFA